MLKAGLLEIGMEGRARLLADDAVDTVFDMEKLPFARGKFAAVRRAFRKEDSSIFAAKFVRKRRRVTQEEIWHEVCVLWKSRDCPFIVHLFQVYETPLDTILILEMAEDGDLQTLLDKQEFLEESVCVDILRDTLKGLLFLHSHSVAHLDIKPANLLVVRGPPSIGRVKICDFGLSRYISKHKEIRELFGTVDYVSPEVLNYEPLSLAVDAWSIGCLTYVLLSGLLPFGGENKQETYLNISTGSLTFPRKPFQHVSHNAIHFIKNLLRIQPDERLTVEESLCHEWQLSGSCSVKTSQEPNNNMNEEKRNPRRTGGNEDDDLPPANTPSKTFPQTLLILKD